MGNELTQPSSIRQEVVSRKKVPGSMSVAPCDQHEVFHGVVFGRSVRMSFCSIHVARVRSIDEKYHPPPRSATNIPVKEVSDDINNYNDDNDSCNSEESAASNDESQKDVALIRIQFMVDNPMELRSYCRRFVKNGDLLSIVIPAANNHRSGNTPVTVTWQAISSSAYIAEPGSVKNDDNVSTPLTIWQAPRLVVNVNSIEHASTVIQITQRNFWSMRQYQPWQVVYLHSTSTIAVKKDTPSSLALKNSQTVRQEDVVSHHGGGLKKRAQGEFIAKFLLHMIASKIIRDENDANSIPCLSNPSQWAQQNLHELISQPNYQKVIRLLNAGSGVYDVAGGSGHVSMALGLLGVSSTVVDPREKAGKLPKKDRKVFQKNLKRKLVPDLTQSTEEAVIVASEVASNDTNSPPMMYCQPVAVPFETLRAWFGTPPDGVDTSHRHPDQTIVSVLDDDRIRTCSAIVALHPDEATDAIVDTAVRLRIPFVIVPCCVFNRLFPHRRMPNRPDTPVSTHQDLLAYLQHKDASIKKATLPFEGSNTILWSHF
jgi:hypothetical protein